MKRGLIIALPMLLANFCASGQTSTFTYQGVLSTNGVPLDGVVELQFTLWDVPAGGSGPLASNAPPVLAVTLSKGFVNVPLDFGAGPFDGSDRWLQIELRTTLGPFTTLSPRQRISPTPYAIRAANLTGSLASNGLVGTYGNVVTLNNAANSFSGNFAGNGAGLSNINAATLGGVSAAGFWRTSGNAGANPTNGNFIGTTDNLPFEIRANGVRSLRIEPTIVGAPNMIGGAPRNFVAPGVIGATIAGGGLNNFFGGSSSNKVTADFGAVGGGAFNTVSDHYGTVVGGYSNLAGGPYSVAMGRSAQASGTNATAIGYRTQASGNYSLAAGGESVASGSYSTAVGFLCSAESFAATALGNASATANYSSALGRGIAQGPDATALGNSIASGRGSFAVGAATASGDWSLASGANAFATNDHAFMWNGATSTPTYSSANNSVTFRAPGGYRFFTGTGSGGAQLAAGATSWTTLSDRNAKKDIQPVNYREVLEKLSRVPVHGWRYRWETNNEVPHLGPMAQDFKAAFYPGRDDKGISTLEFDGVELAAIKGLNEKLEQQAKEKDARIAALEKDVVELKKWIAQLAQKR